MTPKLALSDLYQQALDKWGRVPQLIMALEETAELQKEVCKILRGDQSSGRMRLLAEEIADVRLMCEQLENMFQLSGKINLARSRKVARLKRLLAQVPAAAADVHHAPGVVPDAPRCLPDVA